MIEKNHARIMERARNMARRLADDTLKAIALAEVHARGAYETDIRAVFKKSIETWGYGIVVDSIFLELIVTLLRIHDHTGGTVSLPSLFKILESPSVLKDFQYDAFKRRLDRPIQIDYGPHVVKQADKDQLRQFIEHDLDKDAIATYHRTIWLIINSQMIYTELECQPVLKRLRRLRHEYFAHSSLHQKPLTGTTYGDGDVLLKDTIPIVNAVCLALLGTDYGFDGHADAWNKRSDRFWRFASHLSSETTG